MNAYIVTEGEARPFDITGLPERDRYGTDWIYIEARDEAAALAEAEAWDAGRAITEARLFAVAYRAGAVGLPGDVWLTLDGIADRAGVRRDTVQKWRRRYNAEPTNFPWPVETVAASPIWWWSDVAAWLARPRPVGRPRKG